jgi:ATP-dependent exoDNAse (exonuclease V) beta subunit
MRDTPAHDEDERAAARDARRSFIVQAPAGSGKTELLIQRYLALLARVERPEAIVAMTFTRKAAGEIRERILTALREADPPSDATQSRRETCRLARAALLRDGEAQWRLIEHPARLQVHTIDALCMALVRQAPLTAKVGALPRPVERAESLYVEAAREELFAAGLHDDAWRCLLDYLDNDGERAVQLIAGLLGKREQWLPRIVGYEPLRLRASLESVLADEIRVVLDAFVQRLPRSTLASLVELSSFAANNVEPPHPLAAHAGRAGVPSPTAENLSRWQAIARWLLTGSRLRRSVNKNDGFPAHNARAKRSMQALLGELWSIPGMAEALVAIRTLPPARYDDGAWSFIEALLVVLPRAAARLRLVFSRRGVMDFNEATIVALEALQADGEASDLLLALDTRIEHLLVDEFQDTSFAQCALIERLTAGWTNGDGRTLFLVGDPMQSIYRFRDANVRLFLDARARGALGSVALEPLTLRSNFRSQRGIVEWINRVFPSVLPAEDEAVRGTVAFTPARPAGVESRKPDVTLDIVQSYRGEAEASVARIESALATAAETIAVLVRKRSDLEELLPALRNAGIGFAAVELDRLSERQAILDLAALTHALVQPEDRAAWLAVLRAPWCGLKLPDLFALAEGCDAGGLVATIMNASASDVPAGLSEEGRSRFLRFAAAVAPALRSRGRVPLASSVRSTWLGLGGPACLSEPAIDLAAAEQVFDLIAEHAVGADLPEWPAFADALQGLYATGDDAGTRVRIMTLHKAKGLEFDVVVMPGLTRPPGSGDSPLLLWRERRKGLLLAPIRDRGRPRGEDDPVYAYLRALDADEDDAELRRLLYVGCTRAKTSLHLAGVLGVEHEGEANLRWKPPARGTLLCALWSAVGRDAPQPVAGEAAQPRARVLGVPLTRLPLSWRLPPAPASVPPTSKVAARDDAEPIEFDWARETARRIGTAAHGLLRRMADEGMERWTRERIAAERPRIERELAQTGLTGAEAADAVRSVLTAITNLVADPRGRWLFDPSHEAARSEYALTEWRDGAFVHRVLDRTFVDAAGTRWIVDFKLSRHEGGELERFLDRERERYASQLEGYATAMRALDARPMRLGLYFPLLGGWREWAAPDA